VVAQRLPPVIGAVVSDALAWLVRIDRSAATLWRVQHGCGRGIAMGADALGRCSPAWPGLVRHSLSETGADERTDARIGDALKLTRSEAT
jgi:hypothetical protein